MSVPEHPLLFVGRVRRTFVADELVGVSLDLIRDTDVVEVAEGDEFVTVQLIVDPFEVAS